MVAANGQRQMAMMAGWFLPEQPTLITCLGRLTLTVDA